MLSRPAVSRPTDKVQFRFMKSAMARIELLLIHLHAVEQILLKKDIITEEEFFSYLQEATSLPNTNLGMQVLKEMLQPKDGELSAKDIGTKILKEMLEEIQAEKGDTHGTAESVHKS